MARFVVAKVLRLVAIVWVVSLAAFMLMQMLPGDPARAVLGDTGTEAQYLALRERMGLDQPLWTQYWQWFSGVLKGDFGETLLLPTRPVSDVIFAAIPATLEIAVLGLLFGLFLGLPVGAIAAYRAGTVADRVLGALSVGMLSLPSFVVGIVLVYTIALNPEMTRTVMGGALLIGTVVLLIKAARDAATSGKLSAPALGGAALTAILGVLFYVAFPSLPTQGWVPLAESVPQNLETAFLPALALGLGLFPLFAQLLRADLRETLEENYIYMARVKGMNERHVFFYEALRPSMFSLLTVVGLSLANLMGGTVIVETIFGIPSLGSVLINAIQSKDFPVVQLGVFFLASIYVVLNTVVDIAYGYLDPRIRRG